MAHSINIKHIDCAYQFLIAAHTCHVMPYPQTASARRAAAAPALALDPALSKDAGDAGPAKGWVVLPEPGSEILEAEVLGDPKLKGLR